MQRRRSPMDRGLRSPVESAAKYVSLDIDPPTSPFLVCLSLIRWNLTRSPFRKQNVYSAFLFLEIIRAIRHFSKKLSGITISRDPKCSQ